MVAWVLNTNLGALIADLGPYLGTDYPALPPDLSPFPTDAGEVDFILFDPSGVDPATWDFDTADWADTYAYDGGSGSSSDGSLTGGMHLFVAWYNSSFDNEIRPPSQTPEALVPATYSAIGTQSGPLTVASTPTSYTLSGWITPDPIFVDADTVRRHYTFDLGNSSYRTSALWTWSSTYDAATDADNTGAWSNASTGATVSYPESPSPTTIADSNALHQAGYSYQRNHDTGLDEWLSHVQVVTVVAAFDFRGAPTYRTNDLPELLTLLGGVDIVPFDSGDVDDVLTFDYVQFEDTATTVTSGGQVLTDPASRNALTKSVTSGDDTAPGDVELPPTLNFDLGLRTTSPLAVPTPVTSGASADDAVYTEGDISAWTDATAFDTLLGTVANVPASDDVLSGTVTRSDGPLGPISVDMSAALQTVSGHGGLYLNLVTTPEVADDPGVPSNVFDKWIVRQVIRPTPLVLLQLPRFRYRIPLFTAPTGIHPLRQFPRDDGLLRAVRRASGSLSASRQASIRRGPAGTYL